MNLEYPDTWRYDHDLTKEERAIETKYNDEMMLYTPRPTGVERWHDIYWLLKEWRASSASITAATTMEKKQELFGQRYLLNYYLDAYIQKVMRPKKI